MRARARVWHREAHILSLPPTIQPDGSPLTEHWHQMCGFRVDSETSWPGCASGSVNENGSALSAVRACARDVYCGSVACDGWLTLRGWGFSRVQLNSAVMQWFTGLPLRLVSFITHTKKTLLRDTSVIIYSSNQIYMWDNYYSIHTHKPTKGNDICFQRNKNSIQ